MLVGMIQIYFLLTDRATCTSAVSKYYYYFCVKHSSQVILTSIPQTTVTPHCLIVFAPAPVIHFIRKSEELKLNPRSTFKLLQPAISHFLFINRTSIR